MDNRLAQDFNAYRLIKFTLPSTIMLVFMSLYQMVDGVFVSNIVGENALSALNIVYPIPSIIIAVSIMLSTGGSAIIAKNMGERKPQEAKENFSLIVLAGAIFAFAFQLFGLLFLGPLIRMLGATEALYDYCYNYLGIFLLTCPLSVMQMLFQNFFVTAGKPHWGLIWTIVGGCVNVLFDYVFVAVMGLGVSGAAIATAMGYAIPAIVGLLYFSLNRKGTLYFVRPKFRGKVLLFTCANGSSEMVNNIAVAITTFLFNVLMLKYAGEAGVAAITVVLYAQFLMTSVFMGFSSGVAPVISFNFGKQNHPQLKKVFKICLWVIGVVSLLVFALAELGSSLIIRVFAGPETDVFALAKHGFTLFSLSFLVTGVNIFASAMFTAFSDGLVSAIISFLRTFVFLLFCLLVLPLALGLDGIWLAVPVAEGLAVAVSIYYLVRRRKRYCYA